MPGFALRATPWHSAFAEWRRPGSNRQPLACKANALPVELRPRSPYRGNTRFEISNLNFRVGPGRIELPTSRLSGVRSNRLSYEPEQLLIYDCGLLIEKTDFKPQTVIRYRQLSRGRTV